MEEKFTRLLDKEKIFCESEWEVIELAQRLRRNGFNMDVVEIDLEKYTIWIN